MEMIMRKLLISLVMVLATICAQGQEKTTVTINDTCKVEGQTSSKTVKVTKKQKMKKLSKKEQRQQLMKRNKTASYVEASAEDKHKDSIAGVTNLKLY